MKGAEKKRRLSGDLKETFSDEPVQQTKRYFRPYSRREIKITKSREQ
jgi:hypothetical protein